MARCIAEIIYTYVWFRVPQPGFGLKHLHVVTVVVKSESDVFGFGQSQPIKQVYLFGFPLSLSVTPKVVSAFLTHTHTEGKRLLKLTTAARERARLIQPVPSHPLPLSRRRCLPPSLFPSVSTGWLSLNAEVYTQLSCCRRNQDERWCDN